jgi:hypothetical protein
MRRIVPVLAALALLAAVSAMAQPSAKAPDITPETADTVKAMSAFLASQPVMAFTVEVQHEQVYPNGQTLQLTRLLDVALKRPDKLFIRITGDERDRVFVYDGKTVALADLDKGVYSVLPAPPTVDELITMLADTYGLNAPTSDFLVSDPAKLLLEHVLTGDLVGNHLAAGMSCRHLLFTQKDVDWQLWVEDGKKPLPRKLVITDKEKMGWPQYAATFTRFNFHPRLPAGLFTFTPAKNARKIDFVPLAKGQAQGK